MWTIFRVQNQLQNFTYLGGIEKFVKTILTVSALLGLKLKKKKHLFSDICLSNDQTLQSVDDFASLTYISGSEKTH